FCQRELTLESTFLNLEEIISVIKPSSYKYFWTRFTKAL
ncbi:MAG: hypothetical protein ACI9PZ_002908, partial [Parvicella sp.]